MSLVILVPVHQPQPTPSEEISLRQLFRLLGHHPIRLLCPRSLDVSAYQKIIPQLQIDRIDDHWLSSMHAYNCLMVSRFFYDRLKSFEWLLLYQLDAFIFSDQLPRWLHEPYDFVGAPWFEGFDKGRAYSDRLVGAGNSGFCLKRIPAFARVLREKTWVSRLPHYVRTIAGHIKYGGLRHGWEAARLGKRLYFFGAEDLFWAIEVPKSFPWFRVAPPEVAMQFSFEDRPRTLYRMNGRQLPFGTHAWEKLDPEFWKPFIEACGYTLPGLRRAS